MTEKRQESLVQAWGELSRRQLSNSDNLGRAILSLSTASLGVSVAFLSRSPSLTAETNVSLLHASWWAFAFAIVPILISYQTSQWGLAKQFAQIRNEMQGKPTDPKLERKVQYLFRITDWLGYLSLCAYFGGIALTVRYFQTH